jgi:putative acetyltransferase
MMRKMPAPMQIRHRTPKDDAAIGAVVTAAFKGPGEAALIEALRRDGAMVLEMIALAAAGDVAAHIAFSRLEAESDGDRLRAVSLAPLAVAPAHQRTGIGGTLTRAALAELREKGEDLAIVLGHPAYYPRFGFSALQAKRLDAPYSGPSFMALELRPGAIGPRRWRIVYPRAFDPG